MIVVDSNILAYCWLNGDLTSRAQALRLKDPDWRVPLLWRSEMRSILSGYWRSGALSPGQVRAVMTRIEAELSGSEHLVESDDVFKVVGSTRLSAYDSELVALARRLSVPLVTEDRAVLKACPDDAWTIASFLAAA